jgi:acyl-CoA dehydrogenase
MAWDFETDPEYQQKLDWARTFVREEVEPLDMVFGGDLPFTAPSDTIRKIIDPLKQQVRMRGLWATHLEPELGGQGHGALKLSLLNEILGRSSWAPIIFGCQAPDTGNAEIIAKYGTEAQKERYLKPLLDGEVFSSYSMTEPEGGSDPTQFKCRAVKVKGEGEAGGDEWVINGYKFFSSNAKTAAFVIVMVVTDPDAPRGQGMSMFLVPTDTPGVNIERNVGLAGDKLGHGSHALIHYEGIRVPADALLGGEGQAFVIAQTRLGGGRIHHAMRTIGQAQKALDMMCERALSRYTSGSKLSDKQFVQGYIADSYAQLLQFRLMVLYTAWEIDKYNDYKKVRKDIAAVKITMPGVLHDIASRALQVHGALGASNEMPFAQMVHGSFVMGLADGPTEVHKVTVAKQVLRDHKPADGLWPSEHLPARLAAARQKYAAYLENEVGNL